MTTVTVEQGQCMMDIAVQHCGDATALFEIAELNGKSFTDLIDAGTNITIPDAYNPAIVKYLADKMIVPATSDAAEATDVAPLKGIGYMTIGSTFKVK
jgi:hypothetical protein